MMKNDLLDMKKQRVKMLNKMRLDASELYRYIHIGFHLTPTDQPINSCDLNALQILGKGGGGEMCTSN